jgi:hypothetical protein
MIFIDIDAFDQSKLEYLLRKIPEALVRVEKSNSRLIKYYNFPYNLPFSINCEASYFNGSKIPSEKKCELSVNQSFVYQEIKFNFDNTLACDELKKYLPYGKLRSSEIFYGQTHSGKYKDIFKYSFDVTKKCEATFAVKE